MERVDPAFHLLRIAGRSFRRVGLEVYDPATDAHAAGASCRGHRDLARVETVAAEGGEVRTVRTTWVLVGPAGRPTLRSRVVDGSDVWVIDDVTPDPVRGEVYTCETTRA